MLKFKFTRNWSVAGYSGFYYILTHPNKTAHDRLVNCSSNYDCREFYVRDLRQKIESGAATIPIARRAYALITTGRCHDGDLPGRQNSMDVASEKSLYIINSFEKQHKWQRTKIYPTKCENMSMPLMFFSGPKRWTMSPYLMSIWSLMIRLGRNGWLPKNLLKLNHEDLVRQLAISAKTRTNSNGDANQVSQTIREWDNFMFLYKDMFGGDTRKFHWDTEHLHGGGDRPEGILKLINGTTYYKSLHNKYFKLKEAQKLK
jgi:hypothetical protein